MKAILVRRAPAAQPVTSPQIGIIPSSAMVLGGKPLFLPDFADGWEAVPTVAFRLSRLGKAIGLQFARRYYDAAAVAVLIQSPSLLSNPGLQLAFDGALVLGAPVALSEDEAYTLQCSSPEFSECLNASMLEMPWTVKTLSDFMTLQMGDWILPTLPLAGFPVEIGDKLAISLNGKVSLNVRIK